MTTPCLRGLGRIYRMSSRQCREKRPSPADHRRPLRYCGAVSRRGRQCERVGCVARSGAKPLSRRRHGGSAIHRFLFGRGRSAGQQGLRRFLAGERRRDSRRDRIGMCRLCAHRTGSQQTPPHLPIAIPSTGDFLGVIGNEASRDLVTAIMSCGNATVPSLKMIPLTVPGKGELLPDTRRSDHAAFWDQELPAVMLTDTANFRNPHYHQPTDTIETLDLDFLSHMVPLLVAIDARLAGDS